MRVTGGARRRGRTRRGGGHAADSRPLGRRQPLSEDGQADEGRDRGLDRHPDGEQAGRDAAQRLKFQPVGDDRRQQADARARRKERRVEHLRRTRDHPGRGHRDSGHAHRDDQAGRAWQALARGLGAEDVPGPRGAGRRRPGDPGPVQAPGGRAREQRDAGRRERRAAEAGRQAVTPAARRAGGGAPQRPRDRDGQRAEELDGDRDPEGDPRERLVDREVHKTQGDTERKRDDAVGPRVSGGEAGDRAGGAPAGHDEQDQRGGPQAQRGDRRGRELAEQAVGDPRP
jgi:hypothetical protein